jgi:hypothetical protein
MPLDALLAALRTQSTSTQTENVVIFSSAASFGLAQTAKSSSDV